MPGHKKRTNLLLLLIAVLLCSGSALLFSQSSAEPSMIKDGTIELFVPKGIDDSNSTSDTEKQEQVSSQNENSQKEVPSVSPTATPTPAPTATASPEAASGIWASSGSNWMFLVNGTPYTGWLTDTDGKRYFFNQDGIMHTGWLDYEGKRYYMDLDGIMQTGIVTVDGKSYELLEDGSLKGYTPESPTPAPTQPPEASAAPAETSTAPTQTAEEPSAVPSETPTPSPEPREKKYAALTFDDGPSSFTGRLLDCLENNHAKATFFMVGKEVEYFSEEVKRMDEMGCELGNHTYEHTDLTTLSPEDMTAAIADTDELLLKITGHGATVVRPPYGAINDSVKATIGTPMILWSIDTEDWKSQDPQQIVDLALSQIQDGSIILMHDIFSTSVDAAEILIPELISQGYELVTVHELAEIRGIELQPGTVYRDLKPQQ